MSSATDIRSIMREFAAATGLTNTAARPRRYLWTDAFAVCNFLELYRQTGEENYLHNARKLVDQVHFVLGRYGEADSRRGWISGLDEQQGREHPTCAGLRIGKNLAERKPDEPFDERLEWERDGQYFHYLTKWMQALARVASVTGEARYQRWALELAKAAHAGFTYLPAAGKPRRMYWKMSIDLSRPLVASMGHHDPLNALITYMELAAVRRIFGSACGDLDLAGEIADCQAMCAGKAWATDDPLGTGELLVDALRLAQMRGAFDCSTTVGLERLLADSHSGLDAFVYSGTLDYPAAHRLAFRELGLAIGLRALARLRELTEQSPGRFSSTECQQLAGLGKFGQLSGLIGGFWSQEAHQRAATWREHPDINVVMLATCLAPDGYLLVRSSK